MLSGSTIGQVTVVDDDELDRESLMDDLRDNDIEPKAVTGQYGNDINRLIRDVDALKSAFVICDHRLQPKGFASFVGATVVERLVAAGQPAMLLTMFKSTNRLELRGYRHGVPVIIGRNDFMVESIGHYAEICRREINQNPVDERKPHRVLMSVEDVHCERGQVEVDVVIPSWRPGCAITIPGSVINPSLLEGLASGVYLVGDVNIDAVSEDDIFFKNVDEIVAAPPM